MKRNMMTSDLRELLFDSVIKTNQENVQVFIY